MFVPLTHWDAVANKPEDIAKETTLLAESQAIQDKIDNIKLPEVDTFALAKQGENPEATNSKILEDTHDVAQFFGLPAALPEGYEFMTPEEVCSTLEDIMTSMDLSLTPQQAQAITQQTLTPQ